VRKYKVIAKGIKPKSYDYWEDVPFLPALSVYETDETPVYTGLVDQAENPIYSIPDKRPIGFINRLGHSA